MKFEPTHYFESVVFLFISLVFIPISAFGQGDGIPFSVPTNRESATPILEPSVPTMNLVSSEMTPVAESSPVPSISPTTLPTISLAGDRSAGDRAVPAPPAPMFATVEPTFALETPTPIVAMSGSFLELSVEMAEADVKINPSFASKIWLATQLDKLGIEACFREGRGNPEGSPKCRAVLQRIEASDPTSPLLPCVRSGTQSSECVAAFSSQGIEVYEEGFRYRSESLDTRFLNSPSDIGTLAEGLFGEDEVLKKRAAVRLLDGACKTVLTGPLPETAAPGDLIVEDPAPSAEETSTSDDTMSALMDKLSDVRPTPAPVDVSVLFNRIRLLSVSCREAIDSVQRAIPGFARAVCFERGSYSPACIEADRLERFQPTPTLPAGVTPTKSTGFEKF